VVVLSSISAISSKLTFESERGATVRVADKKGSLSALAVLLILSASVPVATTTQISPTVAQSSTQGTFPLPKTVKDGTVVRINGSSSMMKINDALAKNFKSQFPKTDVKTAYNGTDAALKAVLDGKADLASVGRPLTDAEKAKGLVAVPVARNKIATFVSKDNPLKASITINQFAEIFRSKVTDLSQLKLGKGKIRLVDRPETSDTRRAFQNYPVFKNAPLKAGANALTVKEDSTAAVIKALGKDGIGYAIADQVVKNSNVRIVPMHNVLPTDPRYPFSQPLAYVYKGEKPTPAVQAFLGFATASQNQKVVEQARVATAVAPQNAPAPKQTAATPNKANTNKDTTVANAPGAVTEPTPVSSDKDFLWLLPLIGILGGGLWWLTRKPDSTPINTVAPVTPVTSVAPVIPVAKLGESRIILTPRNTQSAYAYWEIPHDVQEDLRRQGRRGLKLRLYDVTSTDTDLHPATLVHELNCVEREPDLHVPIPAANRDYYAEIGYPTSNDGWYKVASSPQVRVAADMETPVAPTPEQLQAADLWGNDNQNDSVPEKADNAVMGLAGAAASGVGLLSLLNINRQSQTEIQQPSNTARAVDILDTVNTVEDTTSTTTSTNVDNGQVILVQRTENEAYAYWEIPAERKADFIKLGGRKLGLRLYDVTDVVNNTDVADINLNGIEPVTQYECSVNNDLHIHIPETDRDYVAQLGYIRDDGDWLKVKTSEPVRISSLPPVFESDTNDISDTSEGAVVQTLRSANKVENGTNGTNGTNGANGTNGTKTTVSWFDKAAQIGSAVAGAGAVAVGTVTKAFDTNGNKEAKEKKDTNATQETTDTNETSYTFGNGNRRLTLAAKTCQIILVPRNSQNAYAYWEVSPDYKQAARDQGGRRFMLRVHDSTNLDIDYQQPHATQEYICNENDFDKHINIPVSNRDYIVEVGYYTPEKRWIRIIRSFHVRVPAN
jgi:phosphate transport system substrate-binding protein